MHESGTLGLFILLNNRDEKRECIARRRFGNPSQRKVYKDSHNLELPMEGNVINLRLLKDSYNLELPPGGEAV